MAERIERFSTVAATGVSNQVVNHTFLDGTVSRVRLYIPDGHAGFTQWRFFYGAQQLLPYTAGAVVTGNDDLFDWDLDDAPTGTGYNSVISNSDNIAHSFHVELWIAPSNIPDPTESAGTILLMPFVN